MDTQSHAANPFYCLVFWNGFSNKGAITMKATKRKGLVKDAKFYWDLAAKMEKLQMRYPLGDLYWSFFWRLNQKLNSNKVPCTR